MTDTTKPGLEIFSQAWYDACFEETLFRTRPLIYQNSDRPTQQARKAAEEITRKWALGNSSDPVLIAEIIYQALVRV